MSTKIQWTQETWNPTRGCSMAKGSEDNECLNCYAARMAARGLPGLNSPTTGEPFAIMRDSGPRWTGKVELIETALDLPFRRRKPTTWFVDSMSDLFHERLRVHDIDRPFAVMSQCPQHTFQILTKRPENALEYMRADRTPDGIDEAGVSFGWCHANVDGRWPLPNVWIGTSIGVRKNLYRADLLRQTPAAVRFLSLEPLLEDLGMLDLRGIHWVIAGGESGPGARPCDISWIRSIVRQCADVGVACFVKQLGAKPADGSYLNREDRITPALLGCKDRKGGDPDEWPADLRVRQMPEVAA